MDLNCYRTSNNKFFNAPPRMADGRNFTDYRPQCDVNNGLINENKLPNSHEYRMFLTQNAEKLMDVNTKHNYVKNGIFKCKEPYEIGTMLPEAQRVLCNEKTCSVLNIDNNGLGLGRQYSKEPNGLLDPFKQCPQALDDNKCRLTEDNFNYYQLKSGETVSQESEEDENNLSRPAMMGGGDMLSGGDSSVYN